MSDGESVDRLLRELGAEPEAVAEGRWRLRLESAGHPLVIELALRGALLRAEALTLPPVVIDPGQLLYWNAQAPLVCFAADRAGDVLVCGELPLQSLDAELLDRFLGLLHASATRARQFVLPG